MNKVIAKLILAGAALALSACSSMPDWMPGSGAIKVNLSGTEEVPPLTVPGSGSGSFRVADDGTVTGSVTTKDVQGTMAHIHRGAKGTNGPVIVPLDKKGDTYSVPAGRKLTPEQMADLKAGRLYVNVHTERNKGGEVRGQLQP
ncbi:MAG TPA: CHRD domain-containing protein [Burkholderiales bacterium]|nr:CHRD domain-containing protein [Burkholderiales bacterium]